MPARFTGFVDLKTHAKISLVAPRKRDPAYVHLTVTIAVTAKIYTGLSYFTCIQRCARRGSGCRDSAAPTAREAGNLARWHQGEAAGVDRG